MIYKLYIDYTYPNAQIGGKPEEEKPEEEKQEGENSRTGKQGEKKPPSNVQIRAAEVIRKLEERNKDNASKPNPYDELKLKKPDPPKPIELIKLPPVKREKDNKLKNIVKKQIIRGKKPNNDSKKVDTPPSENKPTKPVTVDKPKEPTKTAIVDKPKEPTVVDKPKEPIKTIIIDKPKESIIINKPNEPIKSTTVDKPKETLSSKIDKPEEEIIDKNRIVIEKLPIEEINKTNDERIKKINENISKWEAIKNKIKNSHPSKIKILDDIIKVDKKLIDMIKKGSYNISEQKLDELIYIQKPPYIVSKLKAEFMNKWNDIMKLDNYHLIL